MNDKSYTNWDSLSDIALSKSIGEFIKHQRLLKNKTQDDIAQIAGISRSTLSLLERGETVTLATFIQTIRALDVLSVMDAFKIQREISPIELAKIEKKKRKRARNSDEKDNIESDW